MKLCHLCSCNQFSFQSRSPLCGSVGGHLPGAASSLREFGFTPGMRQRVTQEARAAFDFGDQEAHLAKAASELHLGGARGACRAPPRAHLARGHHPHAQHALTARSPPHAPFFRFAGRTRWRARRPQSRFLRRRRTTARAAFLTTSPRGRAVARRGGGARRSRAFRVCVCVCVSRGNGSPLDEAQILFYTPKGN